MSPWDILGWMIVAMVGLFFLAFLANIVVVGVRYVYRLRVSRRRMADVEQMLSRYDQEPKHARDPQAPPRP